MKMYNHLTLIVAIEHILIVLKMMIGAYLKHQTDTDSKGRQIDERMKSIHKIRVQHKEYQDDVVDAYHKVEQRMAILVSQNQTETRKGKKEQRRINYLTHHTGIKPVRVLRGEYKTNGF